MSKIVGQVLARPCVADRGLRDAVPPPRRRPLHETGIGLDAMAYAPAWPTWTETSLDGIGAARQAQPGLQIWKGDGRGGFASSSAWRITGWGAATATQPGWIPDVSSPPPGRNPDLMMTVGEVVDMTTRERRLPASPRASTDGHLTRCRRRTWVGLES